MPSIKAGSLIRILILALAGLLPLLTYALPDSNYTVRQLTNNEGLSSNSITDLALDTNGFLWIGTQGGLSRYDGSQFKVYSSSNSPLVTDRITRVTAFKNGKIYIKPGAPTAVVYSINSSYHLVAEKKLNSVDYLIFSCKNKPLALARLFPAFANGKEGMSVKIIQDLLPWSVVSSVDDREIYYYTPGFIGWTDAQTHIQKKAFHHHPVVAAVTVGHLFLGFDEANNSILLKHGEPLAQTNTTIAFQQMLRHFHDAPLKGIALYRNNGSEKCLLNYGDEVWLLDESHGLLDAERLFANIDFGQINTTMLYDEPNSTLFIGTFTKGLYILQKNPFETLLLSKDEPIKNNIYAQIALNSNWVLNRYFRYNPVTRTAAPLKTELPPTAFYRNNTGIWYATSSAMMIADTNMVVRDSIPFAKKDERNIAGAFLEDDEHTVWFTSMYMLSCIRHHRIMHIPGADSQYFNGSKISALFPFSKDLFWIGHEMGLSVYNKRLHKMSPVRMLDGINVRNIYRAKDGSIWIGSYGHGFFKYVNGQMIAMPLDEGKNLLFTQSITEDDSGYFWIPTNSGLFQCKKAELDAYALSPKTNRVYYYYYRHPGRYTNEFNGGSNPAIVHFQGHLLMPTINGIISFRPNDTKPQLPNRNMLVEEIRVDDQAIPAATGFELPPYFKRLEFSLSAPYIGDAVNNVLEYNLEENGANWYPVVSGNIIFNQLPKGTYHLNVRKRIGFGVGNYAYFQYQFTVRPFWYATLWFLVFSVIFLLAGIYYFVRLRLAVLQKSKINLEHMVHDRTAELKQTIDELHSSEQHLNSMNDIQEKAIAIILHDIQSPLHYLATSAQYFDRKLAQLSPEDIKEFSTNLSASTTEINQLTNDLLQWLILNQDNIKMQAETIDLPAMLGEIRSLYSEIVKFNGNQLVLKQEGSKYVFTDRNKLKLIIRNLVDNANKKTTNGTITLSCMEDAANAQMMITVMDTGIGMTADELEKLTNSVPDFSSYRKGKLGFAMIREFLQLMNGHIAIHSEPGKGTTVTITIHQ